MKILVVMLVLAVALTASLAVVSQTLNRSAPEQAATLGVSGIFFVGSTEGLAGDVLSQLESRLGLVATIVTYVSELPGIIGLIDASSIVVFQSEWLAGKVSEPTLLDFLRAVLPKEAKIVAVGDSTSLLFDALDQVKDVFTEGRNPGAGNRSLAGYKLRSATAPDGASYQGDSILVGHPSSATSAADSILNWR